MVPMPMHMEFEPSTTVVDNYSNVVVAFESIATFLL
jgi:hypothetical protein